MTKRFRIYTDGGARGNPGPAGAGAVIQIFQEKTKTFFLAKELKRFLGQATNNQAEYQALIMGLEAAVEMGAAEVECLLDSELLVKQMNREYRVKDSDLAPLFVRVWNLGTKLGRVSFQHIRREYNKEADRLVNEAIDEGLGIRGRRS
ncbi:ribonuclease HI family protein [Candidatus Uhrbacteria bacterium]|nr:ribonuclease HI family protein [Candidatus Uhrbacteria bacterium]